MKPDVWATDQRHVSVWVYKDANKQLASIELKTGIFVDANPADNKWTAFK
jgi:hypothetical protein